MSASFAQVVYIGHSERSLRLQRSKKICLWTVKTSVMGFGVLTFYVLTGYLVKTMWYNNRPELIDYNILDWQQVSGAFLIFWLLMGFYVAVKFYCPVCHSYTSFEIQFEQRRRFLLYQLGAVLWCIGLWIITELLSVIF